MLHKGEIESASRPTPVEAGVFSLPGSTPGDADTVQQTQKHRAGERKQKREEIENKAKEQHNKSGQHAEDLPSNATVLFARFEQQRFAMNVMSSQFSI